MTVHDHAPLSGSKAYIWLPCPGSIFLERTLPPEIPSPFAEGGTRKHEVAAKMLSRFLEAKLTGKASAASIEEFSYEEAKADLEDSLICEVAVWEKVLEGALTGKAYAIEDRVILDEHLKMWGFIDFWCIYIDDRGKRTGAVVDFKFGYLPVNVVGNAQLAFYAVALREDIRRGGKDLDRVRVAIIQPSLEPNSYSEVSYTGKQLDTWKKRFYKAASQVFVKQKPKFKVGEHCKFCRAKAVCKAYAKEISASDALMLLEPDTSKLPLPETLSKEQIKNVVINSDKISDFLSACRNYAKEKILGGEPFPGLKVVLGPTKRKWGDDEKLIGKKLKKEGVKEPYREILRTITDIEKELTKEHRKTDVKSIMESCTVKTIPQEIVVSENDERPAYNSVEQALLKEK